MKTPFLDHDPGCGPEWTSAENDSQRPRYTCVRGDDGAVMRVNTDDYDAVLRELDAAYDERAQFFFVYDHHAKTPGTMLPLGWESPEERRDPPQPARYNEDRTDEDTTPAITAADELDALRAELDALRRELDAAHRLAVRLSDELDAERATASAYRAETVRLTLHAADVRDERDCANSRWRALLARAQKHPDALWLTDVDGIWAADELDAARECDARTREWYNAKKDGAR